MDSYSEDRMKCDESVYLLRQLTQLTKKGLLHWECTDYNPIQLMSDTEDGEDRPYLAHNVCVKTQYGERTYFAELFESIRLYSGVGYILMELDYDDGHGRFDPYADAEPNVLCLFSNEDMVEFGDVVIPQIEGSAIVEERFADKDFRYDADPQSGTVSAHPLAKLGRKLHNERRLCDYHRAVMNESYRRRMIKTLDISIGKKL